MSGLLQAKATPVMTVATAEMTRPMIDKAAQATIQAVRDGNIEQVSEQLKGNKIRNLPEPSWAVKMIVSVLEGLLYLFHHLHRNKTIPNVFSLISVVMPQ